ncbi:MAG: hypothetical protein H7Z11_20275 [Verrucomicrobia bacterium]|nr:hypothetical protein [Leptolyngbya sp. ES-bin-22]
MNPFDAEVELAIYRAFLRLPVDRLPSTPFMLNTWTRVNDDRWFDVLKAEAQSAFDHIEGKSDRPHPRQKSGALLTALRYLKPLIKNQDKAA